MDQPRPKLGLFDSTSIIVGIIIGSGLFETTPLIASCLRGTGELIGLWFVGGLISLVGALCYAELATAYPQDGGDYVYLRRAYGRPVGFLFAWAQLWVVRPGSVGLLAYVFARYANQIVPLGQGPRALMVYAVAAVAVLTVLNLIGLRVGTRTQNLLTACKLLGLAAVIVVGLFAPTTAQSAASAPATASAPSSVNLNLALILILLTYGGWNEMAYVAAEVRDPRRNILRALLLGTAAVTVLYVVANLAFARALGYAGFARSEAVAADVLRLVAGERGGRLVSILICISALGAINGMIFTGARITYALGREHRLYRFLGRFDEERGTPVPSLLLQAAVTLALVVAFGWGKGAKGFGSFVDFTTPVFWAFFLLVGISLFVLRGVEPETPRPFRVPLYPVVPALFCATSAFMLYAGLKYAWEHRSAAAFWSLGVMAVGALLMFIPDDDGARRVAGDGPAAP